MTMTKEERTSNKHRCYVCGNLVAGRIGFDFHYVKSRIGVRYYCRECAQKRIKGD